MPISKVSQAGLSSGAQFNTFKNRIINGAMVIDQRNAGAAVTADGTYPVDRFVIRAVGTDELVFSAQQDSSAPAGFVESLKVTVTTAETSFTTTEQFVVRQLIEGNNISDLAWGTANAATVTLSFWVRSSLTGTFSGALLNSALDRSYPFTYAISAANTWEQKSVTIAGDTSGTWLITNEIGISVNFALGIGPDRLGTANAWNSNNTTGATGMVQLGQTTGATFYITGVQLEKGSTATNFDVRPYTTELQLCQRYYYRITAQIPGDYTIATTTTAISTTQTFTITNFPVSMRTRPTALEQSGTVSDYVVVRCGSATFVNCSAVPSFSQAGLNSAMSIFTVASGLTNGAAGLVYGNTTNAYLGWSAEL